HTFLGRSTWIAEFGRARVA
ncbi:unnamed protein product, partial [Allacma fusca]